MKHESCRSITWLHGLLVCAGLLVTSLCAHADGGSVDRIYHPYVQALEREVELRATIEDGSNPVSDDRQTWRLGFGHSIGERWSADAYLIGERHDNDDFRLSGYELEALWQLAEQGEYAVDSGLLFELEKLDSSDIMDVTTTLLLERAWGRWSGTANLSASYEFGGDIANEFESAAALQLRYRHARYLEPALELYSGEDILALGPVVMGDLRYGPHRQLHWETGMLVGLSEQTPDRTFRLALEYEF